MFINLFIASEAETANGKKANEKFIVALLDVTFLGSKGGVTSDGTSGETFSWFCWGFLLLLMASDNCSLYFLSSLK